MKFTFSKSNKKQIEELINNNMVYNWKFLSQFSLQNPPKIQIFRNFDTNARYNEFILSLKNSSNSINNYLKQKIFGNDHSLKEYRFIENDYPYNVEKNIKHYNLWFNPNIKHHLSDEHITKLLNFILKGKKYIVFKNLKKNMSVPGILHYHIFFEY